MPSPFPGMNPYLENPDVWSTFHLQALATMAERLSAKVRPEYLVHLEAHLWIHERIDDEVKRLSKRRLIGRGDLGIVEQREAVRRTAQRSAGSTTLEVAPARIVIPNVDIERQRYMEIRDRHNRSLITVIELLSPTNKEPGTNRDQYLAKRAGVLAGPAHFVEIDLLRGGLPMPDEERPRSPYGVMVSRAEERPAAGFWPIALADHLPVIPIPLRFSSHALLDLQEVLHHVYDHGTYADEIYEGAPEPALKGPDLNWARQILTGVTPKIEAIENQQ